MFARSYGGALLVWVCTGALVTGILFFERAIFVNAEEAPAASSTPEAVLNDSATTTDEVSTTTPAISIEDPVSTEHATSSEDVAVLQVLSTPPPIGDAIYEHDFSVDPAWQTDQPENFFWDEEAGVLRAHIENTPPGDMPSRYFVTEVDIDPQQSFAVAADIYIDAVDEDGAIVFGLYADDLAHMHVSPGCCSYARHYSESTLNFKLMTFNGSNSNRDFHIVTEGSRVGQGAGGLGTRFLFETWYTLTLQYDADASRASMTFVDRDTGEVLYEYDLPVSGMFASNMKWLGISMHPDGEPYSIMSQANRLEGSSDFRIDNVRVVVAAPSSPPEPDAASSILFLPGFQGSRLYTERTAGVEDRLWEPLLFGDDDVMDLNMNQSGESTNDIYTKDLIDKIFSGPDLYGSIQKEFDQYVADSLMSVWSSYPYDWRYDVFDIVEKGTKHENGSYVRPTSVLEGFAQLSETEKVSIAVHSNGGLLAKTMIDALEESDQKELVDKLIFIGSPHLGSQKTIGSMLHGFGQSYLGGWVMSAETARHVSLNMPGAYSLLPSHELVNEDEPFITFSNEEATAPYYESYGSGIDTYDEFRSFLLGIGDGREQPVRDDLVTPAVLNASLFTQAANNHNVWSTWEAPDGVEVATIVGVGIPTPKAFHYKQEERRECALLIFCEAENVLDYEVEMSNEGDGTVLAESAAYYGDVYYVNMKQFNEDKALNKQHAEMSGIEPITALIENIVTGSDELPQYVSRELPDISDSGFRISTHSPVVFFVTDEEGRRTGIAVNEDGTRELFEEIPNSYVIESAESLYVGLSDGSEIEVAVFGTGNGTFDLEVAQTENGKVITRHRYEDITVSSSTQAQALLDEEGVVTSFVVDVDGDGTSELDVLTQEDEVEDVVDEEVVQSSGGGRYVAKTTVSSEELVMGTDSVGLARADIEAAISSVDALYVAGHIPLDLYTALIDFLHLLLRTEFLFEEKQKN